MSKKSLLKRSDETKQPQFHCNWIKTRIRIKEYFLIKNMEILLGLPGYCWTVHPHPPSSIHLQLAPSTSTQLHSLPPISFHLPLSSLRHPQHFKNQNIALNLAVFPNLDGKIQSFPFCMKISGYGKLEMLISNPNLDFQNFNLKIYFWANLGIKIQSYLLSLKIGTYGILEELILNPELDFWNSDSIMTKAITIIISIIKNNEYFFGVNWAMNWKF